MKKNKAADKKERATLFLTLLTCFFQQFGCAVLAAMQRETEVSRLFEKVCPSHLLDILSQPVQPFVSAPGMNNDDNSVGSDSLIANQATGEEEKNWILKMVAQLQNQ